MLQVLFCLGRGKHYTATANVMHLTLNLHTDGLKHVHTRRYGCIGTFAAFNSVLKYVTAASVGSSQDGHSRRCLQAFPWRRLASCR